MRGIAALVVTVSCLLVAALGPQHGSPGISGNYVEIRSADVYTGPCFANGEVGQTGEEAILTWSIDRGTFKGVRLDGLSVIAVVRANATLGDVHHDPYPAKSVLIVDEKASERQRHALIEFARSRGGRLLADIVGVQDSEILVNTSVSTCPKNGCSTVKAGDLVEIKTRCLGGKDHICGNEEVYYPPLTKLTSSRPAYTIMGKFTGEGLGVTFDEADRRSAFLGTFGK